MKTVFLTGISGLLGTSLAGDLLNKGYDVRGLVRKISNYKGITHPSLSLIEGDLFSDLTTPMQNVDFVVHAAAETRQNLIRYSDYYKVNYTGTVLLYQTAVHCGVKKFLFISTVNTLGYGSKENPGDESAPVKSPFDKSLYAKSKREAESYLLGRNHTMEVMIINPAFMIGGSCPRSGSSKIIFMGWKKRIVFYPPGGKNFVHVEDVIQAVNRCISNGRNKERYIIAGENLSYCEFFRKLNSIACQRALLIRLPVSVWKVMGYAGDIIRNFGVKSCMSSFNMMILCVGNFYSNHKSKSELGMKYTPIESAISDAIKFLNSEMSHVKNKTYSHGN
jgi:dihydroflavonol-4-reductase